MVVSICRSLHSRLLDHRSLLSNHRPHRPQHFPGFSMPMLLQLRIQQLSIDAHLKTPAIRRHKHQRFDQMLIMFEQFLRQAHGPARVVSNRTVNDLYIQHHRSFGIYIQQRAVRFQNFRNYIIEAIRPKTLARTHPQVLI